MAIAKFKRGNLVGEVGYPGGAAPAEIAVLLMAQVLVKMRFVCCGDEIMISCGHVFTGERFEEEELLMLS